MQTGPTLTWPAIGIGGVTLVGLAMLPLTPSQTGVDARLAYESVVDADIVTGRDDLDTWTKLTFEGDDLELPATG